MIDHIAESPPRAALTHLEIIGSPETREAYLHLIFSFLRAGFDLAMKTHPTAKNDVHFCRPDGSRPYSMIANQDWVLFYFRQHSQRPELTTVPERMEAKQRSEPDEVTVRLRDLRDAQWVFETVKL